MKYFVFIGSALAAICLLSAFTFAKGAPQEAALAAMACAFCIIPYVIYRVRQLEQLEKERKQFQASIGVALERLNSLQR